VPAAGEEKAFFAERILPGLAVLRNEGTGQRFGEVKKRTQ